MSVDDLRVPGRRTLLRGAGLVAAAGVLAGCGKSSTSTQNAAVAAIDLPAVNTAEQGLTRLKEGNQRFVAGTVQHPDSSGSRRTSLASAQHPFALVFSCVDSRVPPELVFDQGLGDLFIARTAGHVIDHAVLGSIQYGVTELAIPLLVVLGHEKCGAVKATVEAVEKKSAPSGTDIDALVAAIRPAAERAESEHAGDPVDAAVRYNVANVVAALGADKVLAAAVSAGKLRIAGARYALASGAVGWL